VNGRIDALRAEMDDASGVSFLISNPVNVRYLTGFESSNAFVLMDQEAVRLLTDGRYIEAARRIEGVEAMLVDREFEHGLAAALPQLAEQPVAYEADHLTAYQETLLSQNGLELIGTVQVVLDLRRTKDPAELEAIRRAARILNEVYEQLAQQSLVGRTEREVAWWFERTLRDEGADAIAFDVTVASGPNAAFPHHHTGDREIGGGEIVIVDAGAKVDGYCSDCTRTFATGSLPDELQRAYATCRVAQEGALAELRSDAELRALDGIAREEIESASFELLHGLGHGVGLEVHELPVMRPTSDGRLRVGNVVTVEPGIYLPGTGGVRIEDLVVVTESDPEVLTPFTKDLLTLD
jgi:Xaa-Pro aminopeptidase